MGGSEGDVGRSFHYRSAPVYLLTAAVAILFGADILIGLLEEAGVSRLVSVDIKEAVEMALA